MNWTAPLDPATLETLGDADAEIRAARDATVLCPLADTGRLRASGPEAAAFLHNLLTNDIQGIAPDALQRAGFCTPKGRLLADFLVWHEGDDLLLQTSADLLPGMLKRLSMYILRAKARLADAGAECLAIGLSGPRTAELLGELGLALPGPMHLQRAAGVTALGLGAQRVELVVPQARAAEVWDRLQAAGARPVGLAAWRWLDIAAGIPRITLPVQEQFVPQMVNFELIGGIGFKKGCYPGQEIVARTQYLGKIKKRMHRAGVPAETAAGTPVYAAATGEQVCGNVVCAAPSPEGGSELLVVVPEDVARTGDIRLGALDGPPLRLLELPYAVS